MASVTACYYHVAILALVIAAARALDGIAVPPTIAAGTNFDATFQQSNSDHFRVFLSAALTGVNGPTCYLINSTTLSSPLTLSIPASVGPSADYYSVGISDLTTGQGVTFSNFFNFTGGTGRYTQYENHLGGASFWDANDLPCTAYECARACAQASYPDDLTQSGAYSTMRSCILQCPGVTPSATTGPGDASSIAREGLAASGAVVTLAGGAVLTAMETTLTTHGSTFTEAMISDGPTVTLGGAAATVSSEIVSLASSGLDVGGTTLLFSNIIQTGTACAISSCAATSAGATRSATSSAAGSGHDVVIAGLLGAAGLAAVLVQ